VRELTRSIINAGRDQCPLSSLYVESAGLTLALYLIRQPRFDSSRPMETQQGIGVHWRKHRQEDDLIGTERSSRPKPNALCIAIQKGDRHVAPYVCHDN